MDSTTYSDSEAEKLFACLMIMQADTESKLGCFSNTKKVAEKVVIGEKKRKNVNGEPGNATKRMTCQVNDASERPTDEPPRHVNVEFSVSDQAKELAQTLSQQSPCFVKLLQTSDMNTGWCLVPPENFLDKFFPRNEGPHVVVDFVLFGEDDRAYEMSYSRRTQKILGGWRKFYLEHKLTSGDALVFNQTGSFWIKVYIIRADEQKEDGQANGSSSTLDVPDNPYDIGSTRNATSVKQIDVEFPPVNVQADIATPSKSKSKSNSDSERLNLDNEIAGSTRIFKTVKPLDVELPPSHVRAETETPRSNSISYNFFYNKERLDLDKDIAGSTKTVKTVKPLDVELPTVDVQPDTAPRSNSNSTLFRDLSDHSNNNIGSDMNASLQQPSVPNFMEVKCFDDFKIWAKGEILDAKIHSEVRLKYYELCKSQNMFLHEHVKSFKGALIKMIQQTVIIAEASKSANISTSSHELENMGRDLKSLEEMGMAVGFLSKRIDRLAKLLAENRELEFKIRDVVNSAW